MLTIFATTPNLLSNAKCKKLTTVINIKHKVMLSGNGVRLLAARAALDRYLQAKV